MQKLKPTIGKTATRNMPIWLFCNKCIAIVKVKKCGYSWSNNCPLHILSIDFECGHHAYILCIDEREAWGILLGK